MMARSVQLPASFRQRRGTMIVACGLFVLLQLMLVHAGHIPETADAMAHGAEMSAGRATVAPLLARLGSAAPHGMDCPAPRWVGKQIDSPLGPPGALLIIISVVMLAVGSTTDRSSLLLPMSRGPDRQAVLQRFML